MIWLWLNIRCAFVRVLQLGEWVFLASGMGQLPQEQDPVSVTAPAAINSTIIIPFRNPTDTIVKVDVKLTALGTFQPPPSNGKGTCVVFANFCDFKPLHAYNFIVSHITFYFYFIY